MQSILNQGVEASSAIKFSRPLWIAGAGLSAMLFMATAFGTMQNTVVFDGKLNDVVEQIASPLPNVVEASRNLITREVVVQRGDNLSSLLARLEVIDDDVGQFLRRDANAEILARQLVPGKTFSARITHTGLLESLVFPLNGDSATALVVQREPGGFKASTQPLDLERKITLKSATIKSSLFGAADEAGIPDGIAIQIAEIFAGDIDFHRDLRRGDRFSVIYETSSHLGKTFGMQRIIAGVFVNDGKTYRAFWHQPEHGSGGYFTPEGRSVRKAFLRSPLEFSRITSGFTNARYHPILRETRAHRGIDYGAPSGTRVRTTGDGIVEVAGVQGGYGKVVMVRHPGNRMTVYGHLSGFASGIKAGTRVSQGDVIGYVGATGIATGPHLHYEFRVDGMHRNPLTIALPDATPLTGTQLHAFRAKAADLALQIDTIRNMQIALLD